MTPKKVASWRPSRRLKSCLLNDCIPLPGHGVTRGSRGSSTSSSCDLDRQDSDGRQWCCSPADVVWCMGVFIIAIAGGGGLELKKCSATAFYKAALIMHLHRVRSAAARRCSPKWSMGVTAEWPTRPIHRQPQRVRRVQACEVPCMVTLQQGVGGDGHEFARVAGLVRGLIGDPSGR